MAQPSRLMLGGRQVPRLMAKPFTWAISLAAVAVFAAAAPAGALGFQRITATFLAEYGADSYAMDQGDIVTFANQDRFLGHGIVSDDAGGAPFDAPVVGLGQVRLLRGAPFLTAAGSPYLFHCPIHLGMTSKLIVTTSGTPRPPDATPPAAGVEIKTGSVAKLTRKGTLRLVLRPSEAVDAVIKASAAGTLLGRVERTYVTTGPKGVAIKLSADAAAAVGAAAGRAPLKIKVGVSLSDVAGNQGRAGAIRTLGGGARKKGKGGKKPA